MSRRNYKKDVENLLPAANPKLKAELELRAERQRRARSEGPETARMGGQIGEDPSQESLPSVNRQLLDQLAGLDLTDPAQVELTDTVKISVELPLWQVCALVAGKQLTVEEALQNLVGDQCEWDTFHIPIWMARLNGMILKGAEE